MQHDLGELNRYTGLFSGGCLLALFFCVRLLGEIASGLRQFHHDYRTVNSIDEREQSELGI